MKRSTSTKANLIYNMLYQVIALITPLITAPYVSRVLGVEGVGIYSYYHSIAIYFVYFAMLGLLNYGNRTIARVRDDRDKLNRSFSEIYTLQLIISVLVIVAYIVFSGIFVMENKIVALILIFHVASAIFDVSWLFFGLEEFKITSIRQMVIKVATLLIIIMLVKTREDLWKYALIMSLGYFFSSLSLWVLAWKRVSLSLVNWKNVIRHLKPCLILFIPIIATSIYRQMDKIMVGFFSGMTQVGYYENAEKLISISLGLISAFSAVFMPRISNLLSKGRKEEAGYLFGMSMEFAMCIGVAIAFGLAGVAKEFVPIFFGSEFEPSVRLLMYLSISIPFITWANIVRTLYLIPAEKDKIYVQSIILGAVLNALINLILIPKMDAMGAVIGTLVAESSVAIYQTFQSRKELKVFLYLRQTVCFSVFGIMMTILVRFISGIMPNLTLSVVLEIVIGAVFYCALSTIYFIKTGNKIALNLLRKIKVLK